jgi:carbon storage regulator CsrA
MLVLSRKSQEAIAVGSPSNSDPLLKITVLDISGGSVRLGFEADKDLLVYRWEIWEEIHSGGPGGTAPMIAPTRG